MNHTPNTHTIAAWLAKHTPMQYALVDVPGTEMYTGCADCNGEGRTPNGSCTGDTAGGWADICDTCRGTGKDLRGCEFCNVTHAPQHCPAIRARLFGEEPSR